MNWQTSAFLALFLYIFVNSEHCPTDYIHFDGGMAELYSKSSVSDLVIEHAHHCHHDHLHYIPQFDNITYETISEESKRNLQDLNWSPIRIHAEYADFEEVDSTVRKYIQGEFFPTIIEFFQNSLKVIQYQYNMTVLNGTMCQTYNSTKDYNVEADLFLFVTVANDSESTWVAWAAPCLLSNINNRPIVGQVNINLAYFDPDKAQYHMNVVKHEITHILGFSSSLYQFYVNSTTNELLGNDTVFRKTTIREIPTTLIILPKVVEVARNYYNCSIYPGLELENQGGSASLGSHWETRVIGDEVMVAAAPYIASYSIFTSALLESSGWYQFDNNYTMPAFYGKGKGCDFLMKNCIDSDKQSISSEFCTNINSGGCTLNGRYKAKCYHIPGTPQYPIWNYFDNGLITVDQFSDNCPTFVPYANGDCRNPKNNNNIPFYQEYFGEYGRCFVGTFVLNDYSMYAGYPNYACFESHCYMDYDGNFTLSVTIGDTTLVCPKEGGSVLVTDPNYQGNVTCPASEKVCLFKCPNNCNRNGQCIDGECHCYGSWSGDDCSQIIAQRLAFFCRELGFASRVRCSQ